MFKPNHLFVKFLRDAAYFAVLIETILLTLETKVSSQAPFSHNVSTSTQRSKSLFLSRLSGI